MSKLVLHTFPPVPNSYSITPFGLKVESFLRINKIPYDKVYTSAFGKYGTIPYLRIYNGDQGQSDDFVEVSDSNEILDFLLKNPEFETSLCEKDLTVEQKVITHSCLRMLEEHTTQTGFYYRYYLNMPDFCEAAQLGERMFMADEHKMGKLFLRFFKKGMVKHFDKRATARGFKRYSSPDVVWTMACEDLQKLEDLLSSTTDQDYFFGRSHPGVLDCTVFGHLSQFLYIALDFPQKQYITENCPNLIRFMEHFKQTHFPDWEALCERQPNEALSVKNPSPMMQALQKKVKRMVAIGRTMAIIVAVGAVVYKMFQTQ